MTEEQIKQRAKEKAKEIEENQTIGIYDDDESLAYDKGYNSGEVAGYEKGFIEGATEATKELEKENAELKSRECWKSCEYANPKAELIGQHIKDVQNLTNAKEIIRELLSSCFGYNSKTVNYEVKAKAEAFLNSEVEK